MGGLRYTFRQLRKSPGFALLSILTLALGIGANIARELGVRMAGAQRSKVLELVLLQGMRLAAIGIVCGLVVALALGRVFSSLLFRVGTLSVVPWLVSVGVLVAVVLLATYLPARRAASIEPIEALRTE
jgi:putative ABC transport system permease protein